MPKKNEKDLISIKDCTDETEHLRTASQTGPEVFVFVIHELNYYWQKIEHAVLVYLLEYKVFVFITLCVMFV